MCVYVPKDSTRGSYKSNFALHPQMQLSASHRLSKQGEGRRDSLSDRSTLAPRQIDFGPAVARKRGLGGWEPWPTPYHTTPPLRLPWTFTTGPAAPRPTAYFHCVLLFFRPVRHLSQQGGARTLCLGLINWRSKPKALVCLFGHAC